MARALGVMPAFITAMMSAYAARDAVWAASLRDDLSNFSPLLLIVFGTLSLAGSVAFVWGRDRAHVHSKSADVYYDDPKLGVGWIDSLDAHKYNFLGLRGRNVVLLPVVALALAVALRAVSVLWSPAVPLAFPVIVFSLIAWLGFFAWLALKEQRESRPWVIFILIAIGGIGFLGLSDNHIVRLTDSPGRGGLPPAGMQVLGSTLLAACVIGAAVLIFRSRRAAQGSRMHWKWVLPGAAVVAFAVIVAVGWSSRRAAPACAAAPCPPITRPIIEDAFKSWTDQLRAFDARLDPDSDPFARRVFVVTSEGGGIRAAYWTARTLQKLSERIPSFNQRTFMLSGVSGGAVGEAVYAACLRSVSEQMTLAQCIDRFGATDLLTPMLGAWLFEDAVARVLPTSTPKRLRGAVDLCPQPGCGFMSRGLWFEQALERGVPKLAEGIAYADFHSDHHIP